MNTWAGVGGAVQGGLEGVALLEESVSLAGGGEGGEGGSELLKFPPASCLPSEIYANLVLPVRDWDPPWNPKPQ